MKAFPLGIQDDGKHGGHLYEGMDLRDYFASSALQGLVVNKDVINRDAVAKVAYEIADAMMKAREL